MATDKKLRSALHTDIIKVCTEVGALFNVEYEANSVQLITELVWKKLLLYGGDLEAFQKHAKRQTINIDDVKLLVRRNHGLKKAIEEKSQLLVKSKADTSTVATKRKRKASVSSSSTLVMIDE